MKYSQSFKISKKYTVVSQNKPDLSCKPHRSETLGRDVDGCRLAIFVGITLDSVVELRIGTSDGHNLVRDLSCNSILSFWVCWVKYSDLGNLRDLLKGQC